jgi:Na+/H+ antiporter
MQNVGIVVLLLAVATALAQFTDRIKIPYPILLVLAGIGIGMMPGMPKITLHPEIVFLVFLPPVLYAAAWETSWPDFKKSKRPITLLAVGCVIFSTCAAAWVAHSFIPGFGWAEAFVLGAIISPPDAVAASAAIKGLGVPRRVSTILEGESLVNDATGLIAYKYAIAAVVAGNFVLWKAGLQFLWVASAGVAVGLLVGQLYKWAHKYLPNNPTTDTTLTFLAPFTSYLAAEMFHLSGVLAVVTTGLFLAWRSSELFSQQTRLQAVGTWNTVIFVLNGIIFILIGLQLPGILKDLQGSAIELIGYGLLVSATVIVGRIIWVYPATYFPRWLSKGIRTREPRPSPRLVTIVAWSGMRGIVSLAAAMALPYALPTTEPFPNRDMIIFITFCVIFSTLVFQGLSLPHLIKWLGIKSDSSEHEEEQHVRMQMASSIIEHIEANYSLIPDEVLNQVKTKYEIRIQRLVKGSPKRKLDEEQINEFHRIQQELLKKERQSLIAMRNDGKISAEVLRRLEYELDLEETRLILERSSA